MEREECRKAVCQDRTLQYRLIRKPVKHINLRICPDGRILGKMGHSERRGEAVAINIYGEQDLRIFESGVEYFR